MSNIIRQVGAGKTFLSPTDFYVEINTSGVGEVELVLPNIPSILANINTSIYQYIGIRFVDTTSNASVNNVVLTAFDGQTINGETQIRLNTNGVGGLLTLIGGTQWSFNQNTTSSGGASKYKTQQLPTTYIPQLNTQEDVLNVAFENNFWGGFLIQPTPLIRLNNGNVASVFFNQSVLYDGIIIYECYDLQTEDEISGYWVAFQVNPLDKDELIKVAELKMTQQFWDNWYDYTYKDPAITNQVKFVTFSTPSLDTTLAESYITTLSYSNGVLTATDSFIDFGGVSFLQMFNTLTSQSLLGATFQFYNLETIGDDNYTGMGYGSQAGWVYFIRYDSELLYYGYDNFCSYNVLTGETRFVNVITLLSASTNWSNTLGLQPNSYTAIVSVINHSKGALFILQDGELVNNGENTQGVTSVWSPYWEDNTKVVYITSRNSNGTYSSINGGISNSLNLDVLSSQWYWDNDNIYIFFSLFTFTNCNGIFSYAFKLGVQEEPVLKSFPSFHNGEQQIYTSAFNKGCALFMISSYPDFSWVGLYGYNYPLYYFKSGESNPYVLQTNSNTNYVTNLIDNKLYQTFGSLASNWSKLGALVDEYEGISFTN